MRKRENADCSACTESHLLMHRLDKPVPLARFAQSTFASVPQISARPVWSFVSALHFRTSYELQTGEIYIKSASGRDSAR
jgi:hypothetical protein